MPLSIFLALLVSCFLYGGNSKEPTNVHRRTQFAFDVNAPFEKLVPLFGAYKERLWAEGWDPQFVHPRPPNDQPGAVFTTGTGHASVWINTVYDLDVGHVQYACFATQGMTTLIDIHVRRLSATTARAIVVYERTAIQPEANEYVNRQADSDATKGPEWETALRTYLNTRPNASRD